MKAGKMKEDEISRQAALDAIDTWPKYGRNPDGRLVPLNDDEHYVPYVHYDDMVKVLKSLPSAQPPTDEWCEDCKEYDKEKHCCPRWNRVIRQTLAEAQQWIPAAEKLPEVGQSVLMSVGGMYTAEGCLREDGNWAQFRWDGVQRKDVVGAWMPLPEPWKEEQDDA